MSSLQHIKVNAPSVSFVTLGCAKNEVDTARMKERVLDAGFVLADDPAQAQAVVVNTCSFIQSATEESLEAIFDAAGLPNIINGGALIVSGCMPARYGDTLGEELSEASAFVPCSKEDDIAQVIAKALKLTELPRKASSLNAHATELLYDDGQYFAYVKISDGCNRFCSYCTIPYIRGRYHSFTYEEINSQVAKQVASGKREIVLIAQDTGRWGDDFDEDLSLAWLMDSLANTYPDVWFRVMYVQPEGISDELLHVIASHENICSYLDIPLQHVNPSILKAMNRSGSREEFISLCDHVRSVIPDITLRTTLIAGFPGETEEMFEELCDFVQEALFDYVGVFPYSREEGTRAYNLSNQVDEDEKNLRAQRLRDLADDCCTPNIAERIGQRHQVLIEGCEEDGQLFGRCQSQAPEVDGVTYVHAGSPGEFTTVVITDTLMYEMEGE